MGTYIKKIKNNEDTIFPQTVAEAVLFKGGSTLDEVIENLPSGGGSGTVTGVKIGSSGELIEPSEGVITLPVYPTVPTNVSAFTNDAGYLTQHQDISGKANSADLATVATSGSYSDLSNTPTIPSKVSDLTNDLGFTSNTGTVTGVNVGSDSYTPTSGIITIPAYPTTLPASDVYDWAKASSKPSYSYSEISGTPSLGTAAAKNVPSTGNASTTEVVMGDDTRLSDARSASDVYSWAKASTKPNYTASEVGLGNVTNDAQVKRTEMGAASGVATLGTDGKVPSSQLPSYVDDVLEYAAQSSFPSTGESGKIYVALDTNKTYRWSGTAYVEISPSIVIGTTSGTAYDGASGAALASKLSGIEAGAQVHRAPTTAEVKEALGTGSGTTKYLREDGSWATPPDTNTWPSYTSQLTNNSGFITSSDIPSSLPASDVYSWAKQSTKPSYSYSEISGTPTIPTATSQLTNDSGYITSYTDTKTTTGSTDTSSKIYLVGTTSQTTYDTTYSDNEVYTTNGILTTKSIQVGGTAATIQYNPTLEAIEFVFA